MRPRFSMIAVLAGSTVLTTPSFADVTVEDVWENWQSTFSELGLTFSADETSDASGLAVSNQTITFDIPDEDASIKLAIPDMDLVERGDGTVEIIYAPSASYVAEVIEDGTSVAMAEIGVENTGLSVIASGTADEVTYRYTLAAAEYFLKDLVVEGESIAETEVDITVNISLEGMSGTSTVSTGEVISMAGASQLDKMVYEVIFLDPEEQSRFVMTGLTEDTASDVALTLPKGMTLDDPYSIFNDALSISMSATQGWTESVSSGSQDGEAFSSQSTIASSATTLEFNKEVLAMDVVGEEYIFTMTGVGVPLPISGEIGEIGMNLEVPLSASEAPRQFAMGLTMADLAVPDLLWNIFDPAAILDREPATLDLDITGALRLFVDAFDPEMAEADDFPGEILSMDLNTFELDVAGATLSGSGAFTFDNDDLETFDGLPRPIGSADFNLTGGNTLLDSLIQMGLVSESDAMGARMMMGIFTVAGPGEDELNSRLEVTEDGQVIANGQRLR